MGDEKSSNLKALEALLDEFFSPSASNVAHCYSSNFLHGPHILKMALKPTCGILHPVGVLCRCTASPLSCGGHESLPGWA